MRRLNFAQFQATHTRCDDLGVALNDATLAAEDAGGFLHLSKPANELGYTGGLYIEVIDPDMYRLVIGDDEEVSTDLEGLERRLYQFALAEDYVEPDRFGDALDQLAQSSQVRSSKPGMRRACRPQLIRLTCRDWTSSLPISKSSATRW
jgi:hypothetical protein